MRCFLSACWLPQHLLICCSSTGRTSRRIGKITASKLALERWSDKMDYSAVPGQSWDPEMAGEAERLASNMKVRTNNLWSQSRACSAIQSRTGCPYNKSGKAQFVCYWSANLTGNLAGLTEGCAVLKMLLWQYFCFPQLSWGPSKCNWLCITSLPFEVHLQLSCVLLYWSDVFLCTRRMTSTLWILQYWYQVRFSAPYYGNRVYSKAGICRT